MRWLPAILIAGLIVLGSSLTGDTIGGTSIEFPDKLAHAIEYAALGAALAFAISDPSHPVTIRQTVAAIALTILFGISDEIHQSFVPGRDASVADLVADAVGATIGAWGFARVCRWSSRA